MGTRPVTWHSDEITFGTGLGSNRVLPTTADLLILVATDPGIRIAFQSPYMVAQGITQPDRALMLDQAGNQLVLGPGANVAVVHFFNDTGTDQTLYIISRD